MSIKKFQDELFNVLRARFSELSFDTESGAGAGDSSAQVGDTLLFLMPLTRNDDRALTDLRFVAIDDSRYYVQIFTTIFTELEGGYGELEKAVSALNYRARLGAYGMLPSKREFFHKYALVVRDLDLVDGAQGFAVALLDALDIIREQYTAIYDIAAALASGSLKYEEAVRTGMIGAL